MTGKRCNCWGPKGWPFSLMICCCYLQSEVKDQIKENTVEINSSTLLLCPSDDESAEH